MLICPHCERGRGFALPGLVRAPCLACNARIAVGMPPVAATPGLRAIRAIGNIVAYGWCRLWAALNTPVTP